MLRIVAVAVNTFREAVRDRVLYGVLGIALFVLVLTLAMAEVSLDQQRRIVLDVGLASISLFSVLVAIFLGSSLLYKEIERKTLYVILPKPIRRYEFLLGKYVGIVTTAFVFIAIMGAVHLLVASVQASAPLVQVIGGVVALPAALGLAVWKARDKTAAVVPWSALCLGVAGAIAGQTNLMLEPILAALALTLGEVVVLAAVAMLFSAFSTPFLTALFTFGVWVVGRSADSMVGIRSRAIPEAVKAMLAQLVHVWPNFHLFVPGRHTLEAQVDGVGGPMAYLATTLGYAGLYAALLLLAASVVFQRRNFL